MRTKNSMVEVVGEASCGNFLAQSLATTPVLAKNSMSVVVFIGLILLVGLVVKNAIILIDKVNQLRESGVAKHEALVEGARSRLRPIMMTTLTAVFGFLPLALAFGEGAEVRSPMAITVIGGLLVSTLLTLVVIPVVYDLLDRRPDEHYVRRGQRARRGIAAVASLGGRFSLAQWGIRPTCAPHHTASAVALVGGGSPPRPGEISLAHHGVLFLDELPEYPRAALEALREPLESGAITISRAARRAEFPARIQLVAAMNPCPCGFLGSTQRTCRCTPHRWHATRANSAGPCSTASTCMWKCPHSPPKRCCRHLQVKTPTPSATAPHRPGPTPSPARANPTMPCKARKSIPTPRWTPSR